MINSTLKFSLRRARQLFIVFQNGRKSSRMAQCNVGEHANVFIKCMGLVGSFMVC